MEHTSLAAAQRPNIGKGYNRRLRAEGRIPAVVYGQGRDALPVSVSPKEVAAMLNGQYGRNTVIDLAIEGEDTPRLVIIKDYQVHPWKRFLFHVDFWEIKPDQMLTVAIPFRRLGRAPAEKMGAVAQNLRKSIKARCLPTAIPEALEFDMTQVPMSKSLVSITEIPLPDGVEAIYRQPYTVVRLKVPKALVEDTPGAEPEEAEGEAAEAEEASGEE